MWHCGMSSPSVVLHVGTTLSNTGPEACCACSECDSPLSASIFSPSFSSRHHHILSLSRMSTLQTLQALGLVSFAVILRVFHTWPFWAVHSNCHSCPLRCHDNSAPHRPDWTDNSRLQTGHSLPLHTCRDSHGCSSSVAGFLQTRRHGTQPYEELVEQIPLQYSITRHYWSTKLRMQ